MGAHMHDHARFRSEWAERLNDPRRLEDQVSETDLARLLALDGDEDLIDLGSGTGFYTNRMAVWTTGTVYAVELQPEIAELHRAQGVPANVRLVTGDIARLALPPDSADVAVCIAVYHEVEGKLDLAALARTLRRGGRLVIIDWRSDPDSWENGPPAALRFSKDQAAQSLRPYFRTTLVENLGRFMFAVAGIREEQTPHP